MAFLNEIGVQALWNQIDAKFVRTEEVPSKLSNPNSLLITANQTTIASYDGSTSKEVHLVAGENITISGHNDIITISSSGKLTGTIENATKAEQDASGNVITATYATKDELTGISNTVTQHTTDIANIVDGTTTVAKATTSTTAKKLGSINVGNASQPIYLERGNAEEISSVGILYGGTGATTADDARTNLNVYSKSEVDGLVEGAVTTSNSYTDEKIAALLDGATDTTLDSIKELADAIKENDSAIETLNGIAGGKLSSDTSLTAGTGISLSNNGKLSSGVTITNSGVRSISSGNTNGTISVNTNGTSTDVVVTGLGTAAYKNETHFATSAELEELTNSISSINGNYVKGFVFNTANATVSDGTDIATATVSGNTATITLKTIPTSFIEALA